MIGLAILRNENLYLIITYYYRTKLKKEFKWTTIYAF